MFAVIVTFQIAPGSFDAFMPLMLQNARISLKDESGCLQFDVVTDPDRPNEVFLYELYSNREAFDIHLSSTHFKTFDSSVSGLIAAKDVRTYRKVRQ